MVTVDRALQASRSVQGEAWRVNPAHSMTDNKKASGELTEADLADYSSTAGLSKQLQNTLWRRVGLRDHGIAGLLQDL